MLEQESDILWQERCSGDQLVLVREHSVELWKYAELLDHHLHPVVPDPGSPNWSLTVSHMEYIDTLFER